MTLVILLLMGCGIWYIASALDNKSLRETLLELLNGQAIDWTGQAGSLSGSEGGTTPPSQPGPPIPGGGTTHVATGYPVWLSEADPAKILHKAVRFCVETSGAIVWAMRGGPNPPTGDEVAAISTDMVKQGLAENDPTFGNSNSWNMSKWLAEQGFHSTVVSISGDSKAKVQERIQSAIQQGKPLLAGFTRAYNIEDAANGKHYDAGVSGHGAVIEGYDDNYVLLSDPNAPADSGIYPVTWDSLMAAGMDSLLIPQ